MKSQAQLNHEEKYVKRCRRCNAKLDYYEDNSNYCLPCFDWIKKHSVSVDEFKNSNGLEVFK